jgi:hypothetical protein
MSNDFLKFIKKTAVSWKKTEKKLRKLGYGPALDHDKLLIQYLGRRKQDG